MNLQKLLYRTVLLRHTASVPGTEGCRTATVGEVELNGRTTRTRELGFRLSDGDWAADPDELVEGCGTPGCVMHLVLQDADAVDMHVVAKAASAPPRDLRSLFRYGASRGWFKTGGYAN